MKQLMSIFLTLSFLLGSINGFSSNKESNILLTDEKTKIPALSQDEISVLVEKAVPAKIKKEEEKRRSKNSISINRVIIESAFRLTIAVPTASVALLSVMLNPIVGIIGSAFNPRHKVHFVTLGVGVLSGVIAADQLIKMKNLIEKYSSQK